MRRILFACMILTSFIVGCKEPVDTPHFVVVSGNGGRPILAIRLRDDCRCSVWYVDERGGMIGGEIEGTLAKEANEYFRARLSSRRVPSDATIVLRKDADGDAKVADEYRNVESVVKCIPPRSEALNAVSQEIVEMLHDRQ